MNSANNFFTIAEAYLSQQMPLIERQALEQRLLQDAAYANEFWATVALLQTIKADAQQTHFVHQLRDIAQEQTEQQALPVTRRVLSLGKPFWQTAAVAASVALILSFGINIWQLNKQQSNTPKYSELRKVHSEIEGIKASQSKIIKDLDTKANKPPIENKYSGTGFALTNDGYILTNYHVTKDADSLYIQTKDGDYYKAYIVSFDANTDLAILKVEHKKFKFSKQGNQLPYTFAMTKAALGESIFTLGYPQDEIVYNEGYVSGKNGYMGDSLQYRLELPSEPGLSGAPVFDAAGNVIAMVTGKESNTSGKTYAVSSNAMLAMLKSIPQSAHVNLPRSGKLQKLNRKQQIEKIQEFTCEINVYK